jgi:glycosidase
VRLLKTIHALLLLLLAVILAACDAVPVAPSPTATSAQQALATAISAPAASPTTRRQVAIAPEWARDAVLYQVFVRAFTPEGTLAAAAARLPDLKDIGINLIYLMPIHPIGKLNRKGSLGSPYSVQDYEAIDPVLGTEADLKAFVDKAHSLGMHVIMDLVANHTAWDNVLTTQHPDWYKRTANGKFVPPNPDWTDVIQLDHSNPELLQYFIDITTHYVQADGVDGYRCDYSVGVPLPFWLGLRAALKKINPDVFLLSENDNEPLTAAFDATYDQRTYQDMFNAYLSHQPYNLLSGPLADRRDYGPNHLRVRFLENHDHNRIAYSFQRSFDALKAATTYLLTTDDIPFIENGEEIASTRTLSLFEPDKIDWQSGHPELRDLFKKLLVLRNVNPALRHGDIADANSSEPSVLAFVRSSPEQKVLVLISFDKQAHHVTVDPSISNRSGTDLENGRSVNLSVGLDMPPWSWRIIELK